MSKKGNPKADVNNPNNKAFNPSSARNNDRAGAHNEEHRKFNPTTNKKSKNN